MVSVMAASSMSGSLPSQSFSSPVGSWTEDHSSLALSLSVTALGSPFMTASEVMVEPETPSIQQASAVIGVATQLVSSAKKKPADKHIGRSALPDHGDSDGRKRAPTP